MVSSHRAPCFGAWIWSSILIAGCASGAPENPGSDPVGAQASGLDEVDGGLTRSDEKPAFGDPAVSSIVAPSTDGDDAIPLGVDQTPSQSFHVALYWGHLPPADLGVGPLDRVVTPPTPTFDWNGSLSVDTGAISVRRTLAFGEKDAVLPRENPRIVDFQSNPAEFVEGVFLQVVIPLSDAMTLHFETDALTTDIDLKTLQQKLGGEQRIDGGTNGLGFIGYADDGCARGLFFGHWAAAADGETAGTMSALVLDGDGASVGHLRGIWGHAPRRDADVFFAKYIDPAGKFLALASGNYAGDTFAGSWSSTSDTEFGHLVGFANPGYDGRDSGFWMGRWSTTCGQ